MKINFHEIVLRREKSTPLNKPAVLYLVDYNKGNAGGLQLGIGIVGSLKFETGG